MAKEKLTDETLLDKCSNSQCKYNEKSFCTLHSIMLDDSGACIYMAERNTYEKETTMG